MFEFGMIEWHAEDSKTLILDIHGGPQLKLTRGQMILSQYEVDGLVRRGETAYDLPLFGDLSELVTV